MLMPRKKTPDLSLPLVGAAHSPCPKKRPKRGALAVFYRGMHCPICPTYLPELERLTPDLEDRGVSTVAISSDMPERGKQFADTIHADRLRVTRSLLLDQAPDRGSISSRRAANMRATSGNMPERAPWPSAWPATGRCSGNPMMPAAVCRGLLTCLDDCLDKKSPAEAELLLGSIEEISRRPGRWGSRHFR